MTKKFLKEKSFSIPKHNIPMSMVHKEHGTINIDVIHQFKANFPKK
jgi:hypothetical protein